MKNRLIKILFTIILTNYTYLYSSAKNFDSFIKDNFATIRLPLNSKEVLGRLSNEASIDDLSKTYKQINSNPKNKRLSTSEFISFKRDDQAYSIGVLKDKFNNISVFYLVISPYENDSHCHRIWIKSFDENGNTIDSLVIDNYFGGEGYIRRTSIVNSDFNIFIIEHREFYEESGDNVKRTNLLNFKEVEGKFIYDGDKIFFDEKFYYLSLNDVLSDFMSNCYICSDSVKGDVDSDGYMDVVCLFKKNKTMSCGLFSYDLMIGLNNHRGIYKYDGTKGGVNLSAEEYYVDNIKAGKGKISFDISKKNNFNKLTFIYVYDTLLNNWRLARVLIKNLNNNSTVSQEFSPDTGPVYLIQHSAKVATKIFSEKE